MCRGEVVMPRVAGYSPAPVPNTSPALFPHPSPASDIEKGRGRHAPRSGVLARSYSGHLARCIQSHALRCSGLFQEAAQPTGNAGVTEFAERFAFDLAGAFAGDAEFATDFFEGA